MVGVHVDFIHEKYSDQRFDVAIFSTKLVMLEMEYYFIGYYKDASAIRFYYPEANHKDDLYTTIRGYH